MALKISWTYQAVLQYCAYSPDCVVDMVLALGTEERIDAP